jgi:hypothetical protein
VCLIRALVVVVRMPNQPTSRCQGQQIFLLVLAAQCQHLTPTAMPVVMFGFVLMVALVRQPTPRKAFWPRAVAVVLSGCQVPVVPVALAVLLLEQQQLILEVVEAPLFPVITLVLAVALPESKETAVTVAKACLQRMMAAAVVAVRAVAHQAQSDRMVQIMLVAPAVTAATMPLA